MRDHIAYLQYVLRHKLFVLQACLDTEAGLWRGLVHDWSKFLPSEWAPYVHSFYNPDGSSRKGEKPSDDFDAAWNHHQKCQPHHWQYHVLQKDDGATLVLEMPEIYVREMVADWIGAGLAITGRRDVNGWYHKNKERIILHRKTRALVEKLISDDVMRGLRRFLRTALRGVLR